MVAGAYSLCQKTACPDKGSTDSEGVFCFERERDDPWSVTCTRLMLKVGENT